MSLMKNKTFQKYFVPGIVFQSLVIAGGYGTGRELVEYFLEYGTVGGLLGIFCVSLVIWSVICALTFALAQKLKAFDYRSLFQNLLGPAWPAYEVCYFAMVLLILAVVAASAGETLHALFGLNYWVGVLAMSVGVGFLVIKGTEAIEKFLSLWSFVLYGVYILFLVICFIRFGGAMRQAIVTGWAEPGWQVGGFRYAFYNLGSIPAVLFTVRHCDSPRQAAGAGLLAGLIGILPGAFLLLAMTAFYPMVLTEALPVNAILSILQMPWLQYAFQIVLFGTLIETGTGMIFAITDRFETSYREARLEPPRLLKPGLTVTLLLAGVCIAGVGLTGLVESGYGTVSWAFLLVYVIPILTAGVFKLLRRTDRGTRG